MANIVSKQVEKKDGKEIMKINSSKLGEIEYKEDDIITLSAPLLGFPELQDFL